VRILQWVSSFCLVGALGCGPTTVVALENPDDASVPVKPETPPVAKGGDNIAGEHSIQLGEITIVGRARAELGEEVGKILTVLAELHGEGVAFDDGYRFPFGWTTLTIKAVGDQLVIHEPDYEAEDPESSARPDLSASIDVLMRQRELLDRLGIRGAEVGYDAHVLIVAGAIEEREVYMFRVAGPGARSSGWRLAQTNPGDGEMEVESLPVYVLLRRRPALLTPLLLPPGYTAAFEGEEIVTILDAEDAVVWSRQGAE
jgi:hypothetical protein